MFRKYLPTPQFLLRERSRFAYLAAAVPGRDKRMSLQKDLSLQGVEAA